jgi:undecaprenyl-diphosphatase
VLVAFSRIYLGVHYVSDTLFGIALGIGSVLIAERIRGRIGSETLAQSVSL